eukprot:417315-Hanusia_phi.AAC.1
MAGRGERRGGGRKSRRRQRAGGRAAERRANRRCCSMRIKLDTDHNLWYRDFLTSLFVQLLSVTGANTIPWGGQGRRGPGRTRPCRHGAKRARARASISSLHSQMSRSEKPETAPTAPQRPFSLSPAPQ